MVLSWPTMSGNSNIKFQQMRGKDVGNPWVNQTGLDSLAIETQHHATSLVFCFTCFLYKVLSLAVSQPKNLSTPVYLLHMATRQIMEYNIKVDMLQTVHPCTMMIFKVLLFFRTIVLIVMIIFLFLSLIKGFQPNHSLKLFFPYLIHKIFTTRKINRIFFLLEQSWMSLKIRLRSHSRCQLEKSNVENSIQLDIHFRICLKVSTNHPLS